jgi:hypothetical protein
MNTSNRAVSQSVGALAAAPVHDLPIPVKAVGGV